jgi:hypothetical protein
VELEDTSALGRFTRMAQIDLDEADERGAKRNTARDRPKDGAYCLGEKA